MEPLLEPTHTVWSFPFAPQDWEQTPPAVQAYVRTLRDEVEQLHDRVETLQAGAFGDSYASRRRRRYRSNTRSNVPLYLAQRSANSSLLLASYHQAPERL